MKPRLVHALAKERLLDPGPAAVERLERVLVSAMHAAEWIRAKRLPDLRRQLSLRLRDSKEDLATLATLAEGIEFAQDHGLKHGRDDEPQP